jgi:glyoxylase-like metal-dependent hydrolase (beta-lactamase superfamily II)
VLDRRSRRSNTSPERRQCQSACLALGIRSLPAFGHTLGHTVFHVSSGSAWHAIFDAISDLAEKNLRAMFDRVIADKAVVAGYHFGFPNAGTIAKDGKGNVFGPVA